MDGLAIVPAYWHHSLYNLVPFTMIPNENLILSVILSTFSALSSYFSFCLSSLLSSPSQPSFLTLTSSQKITVKVRLGNTSTSTLTTWFQSQSNLVESQNKGRAPMTNNQKVAQLERLMQDFMTEDNTTTDTKLADIQQRTCWHSMSMHQPSSAQTFHAPPTLPLIQAQQYSSQQKGYYRT